MSESDRNRPNFHDAALIERPFTLTFSEHDVRHLRRIVQARAVESTDWATVRCAVGIYERINEQLTEAQKALLAGPPAPARAKRQSGIWHDFGAQPAQ